MTEGLLNETERMELWQTVFSKNNCKTSSAPIHSSKILSLPHQEEFISFPLKSPSVLVIVLKNRLWLLRVGQKRWYSSHPALSWASDFRTLGVSLGYEKNSYGGIPVISPTQVLVDRWRQLTARCMSPQAFWWSSHQTLSLPVETPDILEQR